MASLAWSKLSLEECFEANAAEVTCALVGTYGSATGTIDVSDLLEVRGRIGVRAPTATVSDVLAFCDVCGHIGVHLCCQHPMVVSARA